MHFKPVKNEVKSPLRYPGGKSRAIKQILPRIPEFKEFREPFVGGGSVFFALKQRTVDKQIFRINDLNTDLYCFFKSARNKNENLIDRIQKIKASFSDGRELYLYYRKNTGKDCLERAVRFFVMNRITFSGLTDSGGYSKQAFEKRFTQSSIDRIKKIGEVLSDTIISNYDYEKVVRIQGEDVFIFLDPPYKQATKKKLYGKMGDLHLTFDHQRFAKIMKACNHNWLITYDDCEEIRELFSFAYIREWNLQYGMNNFKQTHAQKGKELFISNYDTKEVENKVSKNNTIPPLTIFPNFKI